MNILDSFVRKLPSNQNAIDIFEGSWSSSFPRQANVDAGPLPLFEDGRILWLRERIGDFEKKRVLELGPLEGAHTYMLQEFGVSRIVAVEANQIAYLKCLITKEILELCNAKFLLGDLNAYMQASNERFDLCFASGVLYHMQNPVWTMELMYKMSDKLYLWTHYYESSICGHQGRFQTEPEIIEWRGLLVKQYRQAYGDALSTTSFCGGSAEYSIWLEKESIVSILTLLGYTTIEKNDTPDHPNGPAISIFAER